MPERENTDGLTARLAERETALERAERMARLAHVVTAPDGSFESFSPALPSMVGLETESLPKSTREWLGLIHPDDREAFRSRAIIAGRTGIHTAVEYRVRHSDGTWLHVRQLMEPIDALAPPGTTRWFSTLQDFTAERQAQDEIRRLNADLERRVKERTAELEAANRELAAFDYSITHDLRAPLRHIQGFSRIVLDEHAAQISDEGRHHLARVVAAAERMDRLIDDLYKLSTTSRAQLVRTDVDVSALARSIFNLVARGDRTMTLIVAPGLSAQADRGLLQVVLENLLGNACKFTAGSPAPRINVGRTPEGAFFVRDNGVGFDMAHAARLFEPFRRLHSRSQFDGSGIGLATVRRIVERHGGRTWAESAPGKGTTVFFTL